MEARRIRARTGDSEDRSGWLPGGNLTPEGQQQVSLRLGPFCLLMIFVLAAFGISRGHENVAVVTTHGLYHLVAIGVGTSVLASLIIYFLSRRGAGEEALFLKLGLLYEILLAFNIGLLYHVGMWGQAGLFKGWSGVAAWIIIFSVVIPSTPARTLAVSSVAALMDPLTLAVTWMYGNPLPDASQLPQMFVPTALAVVVAVVTARINYRMGRRLHRARELGSYRLVERLGQGGMGEVWRAEHQTLARPAAIKLIRPESLQGANESSAQAALRRFEQEAQATALLESEHTITLYDFGTSSQGEFYCVMELLDGLDLELLVKRHGPLPAERAIYILEQICDSLAEAHQRKLIHRDIKPANIYLCRRALKHDQVKVLDFGLVKVAAESMIPSEEELTADGAICGTPSYMVPEIALGKKEVDARADIYALGCVAYWLVSGQRVFPKKVSKLQVIIDHVKTEPTPLSERADQDVPPKLSALVHACLAKKPGDRPGSVTEVAELLAAVELPRAWSQQRARRWWEEQEAGAAEAPRCDDDDRALDVEGTTLTPLPADRDPSGD